MRVTIFLCFFFLVLGLAGKSDMADARVCHEDQKCYNWATMGNHKRSVTLVGYRVKVVNPCQFQKFDMRGRIDWSRTFALKGDNWARRYGCGYDVLNY